MEGLLSLAILAGASGGLLFATRKARQAQKERFEDIINPAVANAYPPSHIDFIRQGSQKYNPIMNLMNPQTSILPKDFSSSDLTTMENQIKETVQSITASPNDPSFMLAKSSTANIQLNPLGKGTRGIQLCEKVKSLNCDAFDDQDFSDMCGMCHEKGENSQSQPVIGGLFVSADAKANAEAVAKREGSRTVKYSPTVGKCAPGRFSTNKDQCKRIQKEMDCEKQQNYSIEGCSQCVQDGTFQYLSSDLMQNEPSLIVVGTGTLKATGGSIQPVTISLTNSPQQVSLGGIKEGDIITLEVTVPQGSTPTLAGYLIGTTVGGDYRVDLIRLLQSDTVTGAKPRLIGNADVGGDMYSLIRSGAGQSTMRLQMLNTFTFLSPSEAEAQTCGSTPFITKESSAKFLESSPCYAKGQKPGAYSLNCLQQTFLGAGCTESGEGFPTDTKKAQALMVDSNGGYLSIGAIANILYQKAQVAYTGRDAAGNKLSIPEWDKVSRFCTGRAIVSPCDYDNQETGPLSKECLSYLWTNSGANTTSVGPGPTYTGSQLIRSLNQQNVDRFCTLNGTMAPVNAAGNETAAAAVARAKGGVKAVKDFYNQISLKANDNTLTDSKRMEAVQQCYGVDFAQSNPTLPSSGNVGVPASGMCVPTTLVTQFTGPVSPGKSFGSYTFKTNTTITFTVRPTAINTTTWANLFLFTKTSTDNVNDDGARMPGVWFTPNDTRLHVSFFTRGQGVAPTTNGSCPLNQDTTVTIKITSKDCTVTCTGGLTETVTASFSTPPSTGSCTLYLPGLFYPGFTGVLTNLSMCTFEDAYPSVLDYRPGRTKTPFLQPPIPPSTGCEGQNALIQCPDGQTIAGGTIRYGKWDNSCSGWSGAPRDTTKSLPQDAIGKNSYSININNDLMGDPSNGTYKQFSVTPICK